MKQNVLYIYNSLFIYSVLVVCVNFSGIVYLLISMIGEIIWKKQISLVKLDIAK